MAARFADRVAVVTGGASGIGAATVAAFVAEGARVVALDVDGAAGDALVRGTGAVFEVVDVADHEALTRVVGETARTFGRIDVLVSNAFTTAFGAIESLGLAEWQRTLDVTLTAVFTGIRAVAPVMRAQGGGAIVNVGSISGQAADRGLAAYNAAKAGVINLTRAAALELAHARVRVNAVCPGLIDTPALRRAFGRLPEREAPVRAVVPLGRFGTAAEIAAPILFLASDDAAYVTGTTLVVDGGLAAGTGIPWLVTGDWT